jgi:hypothetical protein
LTVQVKTPEVNLYNNILVKRLAVAKAKILHAAFILVLSVFFSHLAIA